MQHPFSCLDRSAVADCNADHDAAVRGASQRSCGGQFIGAGARKLVVEAEYVTSLARWILESTSQHGTNRVKLVLEQGDHAEVTTATSNPPEEVLVLLVGGR